jgi:hypothetical protein
VVSKKIRLEVVDESGTDLISSNQKGILVKISVFDPIAKKYILVHSQPSNNKDSGEKIKYYSGEYVENKSFFGLG